MFYNSAPDTTIGSARLLGRKKQKDRITFLACANADGTEKFRMMINGKSANPRFFSGKSGSELGIDYYSSGRAWMNTTLFYERLERFNAYISTTTERRVVLLIDNASCHGRVDD